MSGITLPPIPGAVPAPLAGESRPSSRSSTCSTSMTIVPHVYFTDHCVFKTPRSNGIPRAYGKLPSLRKNGKRGHSRQSSDVSARYSAKYRQTPRSGSVVSANSPYLPQSTSEECLKCLLRVPHKKCESHKYIRVGGGYRHGYWYIKCLLEELEMQRQREMLRQQRLEAIKESNVKAIKTYIRTKSGRLVERIVFLNEEDYEAFKQGKNVQDILKRYLNKDEAAGLESWDKDEVKAIKTLVRTKSGRLIEKLVYVSKQDYEDIKAGRVDAKNVLKKYVKTEDGEQIEGWGEAKMKTIKTYVRTKSGRLIEKVIMISQDDYDAMIRDGKDPSEIIKQYLPLEEGQTLESWQSAEPMKAIKTKVRTKSGRIIEKTIYVSADDYEKMMKGGGDPADILKKYLNPNDGDTIESWEKAPDGQPMKVVKTYIRTKSGRLIEKQVLLTEDEFRAFQESGGDPEFLKKFIKLEKGEIIEDWEKASTVYSATDDPEVQAAKPGTRIVGKDGAVYEVVVDPVTGKKYRKKIGQQESDVDSGIASMSRGKGGKRRGGKGGGIDEEETPQERHRRKQGKRDADSDSDYSYKSHRSAGGTRHVRRRRKRADGTYSDAESYHSSQDEDGQARRRRRRRERKHGSDSAHSYCSVVSAGGTRHVKRRRKRADGTYSASESYHSSDSDKPGGGRAKNRKKKKKERREHGSDSDHSYYSDVSAGGTHHRKRRQRIRDKHGNVIGHGNVEDYTSPENSDDERRKKDKRREERRRLGLDSASSSEYDELGNKKPKTKGARKDGLVGEDSGLGPDGRKKGRRNRDGNEGDDESDDNYDLSGRRKKKGGHRPGSGDGYEYKYDDKGRIISKKRIKKDGESSGSEYEYEYDADGKVKAVKKKRKGSAESDGDYFEVDEKGQIKLKEGKKKIDLSKLTADDLRKLGIDPNLSKHEIARLLKEKFGGAIQIVDKKKTIGTKKLDEYDSDVKTDDLANDSDLDISTLRGPRRVNVLMRRGGQAILDHIKKVMDQSNLGEDYAKDLDEKGDIDFLSHYRLVDPKKLDAYAKCFAVEDEDYDTVINAGETRIALDGVPTIQQMTAKQMEYVLKVLKIDDASQITFRMFSVISALSERVTQMDPVSKHLIEICDLLDIQRKMNLYKAMFYCNVNSDRDSNFIKADSLRIELIAGGLNWKQQQYIMERLQPNYFNEISFLDYICYIPLFLSMHDNIIDNPLDMSDDKYDSMLRKPSGGHRQRDINPLGQPLDKKSSYQMRQQALDLLEGRINIDDVKKEDRELLQKYTTLPKILESAPSTPRSTSSLG
ncbi:uncharacterized protein LOC124133066 isoform X4 [Haliotis rufescens]|uniref:uncharacterized protein LOC124133066 isoform X4 n=1 Tax=Haliotis rufescens TaxID=6454 RepID=UPI001EB01E7E|nr:uncharacterized protein LOC124133066 isoform X4 [Haliotis rufescens]